MSITVTCGSCGAVLRTKDTLAGKTAKCPHCGEPVRIPSAQDDDVFEAEEVAGDDDFGGGGASDFDFGSFGRSTESIQDDERKPCPACGEMIQKKAAKCRYCGEIFDPALKRRTSGSRSRSRYGDDDDNLNTVEWLVVIFCGFIGCIVGIIYMIQGKPKGSKMLGYSIAAGVIWRLVGTVISLILENA